jgi:hypothetical protein
VVCCNPRALCLRERERPVAYEEVIILLLLLLRILVVSPFRETRNEAYCLLEHEAVYFGTL